MLGTVFLINVQSKQISFLEAQVYSGGTIIVHPLTQIYKNQEEGIK